MVYYIPYIYISLHIIAILAQVYNFSTGFLRKPLHFYNEIVYKALV